MTTVSKKSGTCEPVYTFNADRGSISLLKIFPGGFFPISLSSKLELTSSSNLIA
tara:strand:- start:6343 stop:6504 length:162 start_codon:yes stop_codon:yes gene_type:complete